MSKKKPLSEKSPKLTVPEVIEYCKNDLGITFNLMIFLLLFYTIFYYKFMI